MVKKLSVLALAGLLALPGAALAGGSSSVDAKIAELTRQLEELKSQVGDMEESSEAWDLASRIQFSGDFRARGDYRKAETAAYVPMLYPNANGQYIMNTTGMAVPASQANNDTVFTNRFRLNMRVKATENVEVKARLAMYKTWGQQSMASGMGNMSGFPIDAVATREARDSILRVDRVFANWNNIGGNPLWFSVGRRPTTDGPPSHLRMNSDQRLATPTAFMDWPFDGVSVGYAYRGLFGMEDTPGRIRFCWGRGFEDGVTAENASINDTDFAGFSWDIYKKGNRFLYLQSFAAMGVFNYPSSADGSMEYMMGTAGILQQAIAAGAPVTSTIGSLGYTTPEVIAAGQAGRANIGNIYHTSGVYMDKVQDLNYFVSLGMSQTAPDGGGQGMLGSTTEKKDGYAIHAGVRYDVPDAPFKLGFEYNHGTENWIGMTPGNDDMYGAKLATRGDVYEVYTIWDIPAGEATSKYGKAFIRLGYQYYDYAYSGSGDWNALPVEMDQLTTMLPGGANMQMGAPVETADQVYLTFEAMF